MPETDTSRARTAGHPIPDTATAVVLVPGLNNSARTWRDVLAELPGHVTGIAVDCPPLQDVEAVADALLADLPDRFVAVGHSFGGYAVMAMLARQPHRIQGLVLVNTGDNADTAEQAAARRARAEEVGAGDYEAMAMALAARAYHPEHAGDERLLADRLAGVREYGAERYRAHLIACATRPDRSELLARSSVPVLVLTADHDEVVPTEAQTRMAHRIGAQQQVIATAGHMLPAEQPAAVAAAIAAFVADVAGPADNASAPARLPDHDIAGVGELTVFLLHGAYGDGRYFAHTRDVLVAAGYRVVTWDCPGYGTSPAPADTSIAAHARAAADLVQAVGTGRNVLLGHSMGGLIAPLAATLAGGRVDALVLSCTSAGMVTRTAEERRRFFAERVDPITEGMSVGEYAPGLLRTMMGPAATGPLVDEVVRVVCEMRTDTFKASMAAIATYDGRDALRGLTVPAQLIAGELDPACPVPGMQLMADLIPDSRLHVIDGVGHYPFAERPEDYHALVLSFLAALPSASRR